TWLVLVWSVNIKYPSSRTQIKPSFPDIDGSYGDTACSVKTRPVGSIKPLTVNFPVTTKSSSTVTEPSDDVITDPRVRFILYPSVEFPLANVSARVPLPIEPVPSVIVPPAEFVNL